MTELVATPPGDRRRLLLLKLAAVPVVAVVTLLGIWITGGVITNDFAVSMLLTALWFAGAGAIAFAVAWRRRLWWPVFAPYVVTAAVVGGYLAYESMVSTTVNEQVARAGVAGNVEVAGGTFRSIAHATEGRATIVRLASGRHALTLVGFETDPGPDLRVYLVEGKLGPSGNPDAYQDLGALKGNRGTQQYEIPADLDASRYGSALIWCRAFSVPFGAADLM